MACLVLTCHLNLELPASLTGSCLVVTRVILFSSFHKSNTTLTGSVDIGEVSRFFYVLDTFSWICARKSFFYLLLVS